jgi:hypothetical protein
MVIYILKIIIIYKLLLYDLKGSVPPCPQGGKYYVLLNLKASLNPSEGPKEG